MFVYAGSQSHRSLQKCLRMMHGKNRYLLDSATTILTYKELSARNGGSEN